MNNNLFYYATSELSQDAFICWLVSFSAEGVSHDTALAECAKEFLSMLVPELKGHDVRLISIERQVGNRTDGYIDVLLTVSSGDKNYKIIVEDKTFTDDHDDQLGRYLEIVQKKAPNAIVRGAYYKTGFQNDLTNVIRYKYAIITRSAMLGLMARFINKTQNTIFADYYEYWNNFHKEALRFKELPLAQWDRKHTNGFYSDLCERDFFNSEGFWSGFGYVANQTGGFDGLWFGNDDYCIRIDDADIDFYLQLETYVSFPTSAQLCLKMSAARERISIERARQIRDSIVYDDSGTYSLGKYHFERPARLGSGRTMTIGVYSVELTCYESVISAIKAAIVDYKKIVTYLHDR